MPYAKLTVSGTSFLICWQLFHSHFTGSYFHYSTTRNAVPIRKPETIIAIVCCNLYVSVCVLAAVVRIDRRKRKPKEKKMRWRRHLLCCTMCSHRQRHSRYIHSNQRSSIRFDTFNSVFRIIKDWNWRNRFLFLHKIGFCEFIYIRWMPDHVGNSIDSIIHVWASHVCVCWQSYHLCVICANIIVADEHTHTYAYQRRQTKRIDVRDRATVLHMQSVTAVLTVRPNSCETPKDKRMEEKTKTKKKRKERKQNEWAVTNKWSHRVFFSVEFRVCFSVQWKSKRERDSHQHTLIVFSAFISFFHFLRLFFVYDGTQIHIPHSHANINIWKRYNVNTHTNASSEKNGKKKSKSTTHRQAMSMATSSQRNVLCARRNTFACEMSSTRWIQM